MTDFDAFFGLIGAFILLICALGFGAIVLSLLIGSPAKRVPHRRRRH
jgi:hypothetical protein